MAYSAGGFAATEAAIGLFEVNLRCIENRQKPAPTDLDSFQYESHISLELLQEPAFPFASGRGRQYPYWRASPVGPASSDDCLFL